MPALIARLKRAGVWIRTQFAAAVARVKPSPTLQELLRMAAFLEGLARAQLEGAFGQERLYGVYTSYRCVLERNRLLRESGSTLDRLDSVLSKARRKLVEIELAMSLPVKRGVKPDKLDQQNLLAVQQHLAGLEATAQRLRRILEKQEKKQRLPA